MSRRGLSQLRLQAGLGEEGVDKGGPVMDAFEPVLDDRGELVHIGGGEVAQAVANQQE